MTKLWIILGVISLTLVGCERSPEPRNATPDETYREYYQRVIKGINYEDGKRYHSKAFTQKLETRIKTAQQSSSNSYENFMTIYFKRQQSSAKCNEITLVSERIDGEVVELVYNNESTCENNKIVDTDEIIRMVNEDGWKIDDIAFASHGS